MGLKNELKMLLENKFKEVDFSHRGKIDLIICLPITLNEFNYETLRKRRKIKGISKIYVRRRKSNIKVKFILAEKFFYES